jgi:putative transposase
MQNPFHYFNSSPEVIRLAVMMYIRYPLSLRQVEDLLFERGIDICHETVRFWWSRKRGVHFDSLNHNKILQYQ